MTMSSLSRRSWFKTTAAGSVLIIAPAELLYGQSASASDVVVAKAVDEIQTDE